MGADDETGDGGEAAGGAVISVVTVFAGFEWCFEDFLAIFLCLYSFRP